ncbi:MAG: hypothetical protein ABIG95_04070 [Candidatus Woesearchaeota archaeon]
MSLLNIIVGARSEPMPFDVGDKLEANVVGEMERKVMGFNQKLPYAWVGPGPRRVRVFLHHDSSLCEPGSSIPDVPYQCGDRVSLVITQMDDTCAYAVALENTGCFIKELLAQERVLQAMLTARSKRDARDAVSIPWMNGGIGGVLTVVRRTKFKGVRLVGRKWVGEEHDVRLVYVGQGKNGYFAIATLADPLKERDPAKDIYVGAWYPLYGSPGEPGYHDLVESFEGIPHEDGVLARDVARRILYVDKDGIPFLLGDRMVRKGSLDQAVMEYMACMPGKVMKIAVTSSSLDTLTSAIEAAGFQYETLERQL